MYPKPADLNRKILEGTTTIGVVCKDGVVLATDTRATMGFFIAHKKAKKVYPIANHLAMTIAGGVADAQAMVDILKANAELYMLQNGFVMPVKAAARLVANILFSSRLMPFILQALIGGVDSTGPRIFALDPLGSVVEETCVSTGSGSPIAYGVLEAQFKEGMLVKESIPIVLKAITSAMKRDAASGDSFDVAIVTSEGYRELNDEEKRALTP
ncbi:MAG: archaeal proteasome endopeptidase complex subunit beta [Candidatus Bathyarchaeia archaeon]|nr:archaeal proteasome endopeptidase complex subunit beta [Candidatus Bathyarchaeota archaeon]